MPVFYQTLDDGGTAAALASAGLGFNLHYDSSVLTLQSIENIFDAGADAITNPDDAGADALEGDGGRTVDGSDLTDRSILSAYFDFSAALGFGGSFPDTPQESPLKLYDAVFSVSSSFSGTTEINFTQNGDPSANLTEGGSFDFDSRSLDITVAMPSIEVDKSDVTVSETGTTATFAVTLGSQPASNVVLSVASNDIGEATVSPNTLTFTPSNWNMPQIVTVTGVDDQMRDGDTVSTVTVSVVDASSDDSFNDVADATVSVTTIDNGLGPDRLESNDEQNSATIIHQSQLITGLTIHSNPDGSDNEDFFEFTANGSGSVSVFFSHAQGDIDLEIFDADGNSVAISQSESDDEDVLLDGLMGTFFARVYGFQNATADYNIVFDLPARSGPTLRVESDTLYVDGTDGNDDLSVGISDDGFGLVVSSQRQTITTLIAGATGADTNEVTIPFANLPDSLWIATGSGDDAVSLSGDRFVVGERIAMPFSSIVLRTDEGNDTVTVRGNFGSADLSIGNAEETETLLLPEELSTTGDLYLQTGGSIRLVEPVTGGDVYLSASLDILDEDNTPVTSIAENGSIFFEAGRDVILEGAIDARGADGSISIYAGNNGTGGVQISGLQIFEEPGFSFEVYGSLTATGLIQIYGADLTTTPDVVDGVVITNAGDRLRVQAGREVIIGNTSSARAISIDGRIESDAADDYSSGGIRVESSGGIHFGSNADLHAANAGMIQITAIGEVRMDDGAVISGVDGNVFVGGSSITMADGSVIDGGEGTVTLYTSGGDIILGGVVSQAFRLNADNPAIDILAGDNGTIIDGGDGALDIDAPNGFVRMVGPQGIGVGNPLEIRSIEDRAILSIAPLDADKPEGDSGLTPFTFTVTRSGNVSEEASVTYIVYGTPSDFGEAVDPTGEVTFAAGETSKTIAVQVAGDSDIENDHTFTVALLETSENAIVGPPFSASGIIRNDDLLTPGTPAVQAVIDGDTLRIQGTSDGDSLRFTINPDGLSITTEGQLFSTTIIGATGAGTDSLLLPANAVPENLLIDTGDGNDSVSISGSIGNGTSPFLTTQLISGEGNDYAFIHGNFGTSDVTIGSTNESGNITDAVESLENFFLSTSGDLSLMTSGSIESHEGLPIRGGSVNLDAGVDVIVHDFGEVESTATDGSISIRAGRDIILTGIAQTLGADSDILLIADRDGDGVGGVHLTGLSVDDNSENPADRYGALIATGRVDIISTDLSTTPGVIDSLVVDSAGSRNRIQTGDRVFINAEAAVILNGRIEQIDAPPSSILSVGINISGDGDILLGEDGDIKTNFGPVIFAPTIGDIRMADGAVIDSGSDRISISGDRNVVLGGLVSHYSGTELAIDVSSSSGGIIDGGDTHLDIDAHNGRFSVLAPLGVGVDNPLETRGIDDSPLEPFTPSAEQTTITIETDSEGVTTATVSVEVPTSGFQANWGAVANTTTLFSALPNFFAPRGNVLQVVETLTHTYELGNLSPGNYSFVVSSGGQIIREEDFSVQPASPLLTFSYGILAESGQPIEVGDALAPGDTFELQVFAREDVANVAGIGSLILDIDFDEKLVEPVDFSKAVLETSSWSIDLTQTSIGNTDGDHFIDNLGVGEPASLSLVLGDGESVLVASIPFRVKPELDLQTATAAVFAGIDAFSRGNTNGLIVNSLTDEGGTVISAADTDFGTMSLTVNPFERFDLNQDRSINTADLSAMRGQLLSKFADETHVIPDRFDANGDGNINTADLSAVRGHLLTLLAENQAARAAAPTAPAAMPTFISEPDSPLRANKESSEMESDGLPWLRLADPVTVLHFSFSTTNQQRTEDKSDWMIRDDTVAPEVIDDAMEMAIDLLLDVGIPV